MKQKHYSLVLNFAKEISTLQTSQCSEDTVASWSCSLREREKTTKYTGRGEKILWSFFLIGRHLHWGYFQLWIDWQLRSQSYQLSIKLSKHKSLVPKPPCCTGLAEAKHIKALASPSLPEGHNSAACQNPCEFTFYSKLHVPAAQCDTIRSWLCVNQMMTAWPCGCLACCHSLVANPLPWESGNWFPDPLWECCSPHIAWHTCTSIPDIRNANGCLHPRRYFSMNFDREHFGAWNGRISSPVAQWEWNMGEV